MMADSIFQQLHQSKRGLLVQLAGLGDLIMALPAIDSLQASLPHIRWTMLTRAPQCELMVERMAQVETMAWPPNGANFVQAMTTIMKLRRQQFDFAIHLYGVRSTMGALAMKALFLGIHPRLSIGRVATKSLRLFDVNWEEAHCPSLHEVDLNQALVQSLGVPTIAKEPALLPKEASLHRVAMILEAAVGFPKQFVVIFPGGARPTRRWPTTNFRVLATSLSDLGLGVCVVGGQDDYASAQLIAGSAGSKGINMAGLLSLQDLAALLSTCVGYVGNDSGPTHVAAALGTPCVALFGPGDVGRYGPRGSGPIRIIRHQVECSPCYLTSCSHHTCMRSLTLEEVVQGILDLLDNQLAGRPE